MKRVCQPVHTDLSEPHKQDVDDRTQLTSSQAPTAQSCPQATSLLQGTIGLGFRRCLQSKGCSTLSSPVTVRTHSTVRFRTPSTPQVALQCCQPPTHHLAEAHEVQGVVSTCQHTSTHAPHVVPGGKRPEERHFVVTAECNRRAGGSGSVPRGQPVRQGGQSAFGQRFALRFA